MDDEFAKVLGITVLELAEEMSKKRRLEELLEQREAYFAGKLATTNGGRKLFKEEEVYELVSQTAFFSDRAFVFRFSMGRMFTA
jgi:hypothetical protein